MMPPIVVEELSVSPPVYFLRNLLSAEECDQLIALSQPKMQRSSTVNPDTGENFEVDARSSSGTFFNRQENPLVSTIEERIAWLLQRPPDRAEGLQVLNYKIGQEYKPHFDYFDPKLKGSQTCLAGGGQRVATIVMYLNDVEAGGETILPDINLSVRPQKGCALLFYNLKRNGEVDPKTLHGSIPVAAGEKWGATKWIREFTY
jgi:prolyl 4-hydroxylase